MTSLVTQDRSSNLVEEESRVVVAKSGCGATGTSGTPAALVVRPDRGANVATEAGGVTATVGVHTDVCWDPSLAADRVVRVDEGIPYFSQYYRLSLLLSRVWFVEESNVSEGVITLFYYPTTKHGNISGSRWKLPLSVEAEVSTTLVSCSFHDHIWWNLPRASIYILSHISTSFINFQ